jgi:hypothetical protein
VNRRLRVVVGDAGRLDRGAEGPVLYPQPLGRASQHVAVGGELLEGAQAPARRDHGRLVARLEPTVHEAQERLPHRREVRGLEVVVVDGERDVAPRGAPSSANEEMRGGASGEGRSPGAPTKPRAKCVIG